MGVTPPHHRTSYNLFFSSRRLSCELEKDGCGSEFIVGSFENRLCMSNFGVDFARYIFQIYPLILSLHAYIGYQNVRTDNTTTLQ